MVIPSARLLGLGSKLYPSDMQRMLKKDLTRLMQSLSRIRQNRASERKHIKFCKQNTAMLIVLCEN